jgi:putative hydrolase of the HAD superfamily
MADQSAFRAVLFDLGGVVFDSPLAVIADYEREIGLTSGLVNRTVVAGGTTGAWSGYERGEISFDEFVDRFGAECGGSVDVRELMRRINAVIVARPSMIALVSSLRERGFRVAALTNNWEPLADPAFKARFDVVVESSVEGMRKPEPEIYRVAVDRLGVEPSEIVFLDDIGANLKPARSMGMTTIKVVSASQAIDDLAEVLG